MDGGMKSMRRRRPEEGVEGWAGVASHRMLPFTVMGGSEGLSRLPAYLAAAPALCVMGVVGGTLARVTRSHPQSNRCNGPPTPCRPPAGQPEPPREKVVSGLWPVDKPVACGLDRMGEVRIEGPRAGLADASCSPCPSPPPASLSQPCLLASAPLLLLSCCSPLCPSPHRLRASAPHLISRPACAPLYLHSQSAFTALKLATSGPRRAASLVTAWFQSHRATLWLPRFV
jgi:hypothetical protein